MKITDNMVEAAVGKLAAHQYRVQRSVVRQTLELALWQGTSDQPTAGETPRERAMRIAKAEVDAMCVPPTNERGYVRDGWKAPTLTERVSAIRDLTALLLEDSSGDSVPIWQDGPGLSLADAARLDTVGTQEPRYFGDGDDGWTGPK